MPVVAILCPHWGSVSMEWVETTYGPLRFIPQPDFAKAPKLSRGILNLAAHRNALVKMALEDKTVTYLLWLDSDNICESPSDPNQALRMLLSLNVPIVSGLYRAKKSKGLYPYAMWMKNPAGIGYLAIENWTGNWITADVIGFGFVLIKREVFEKVPYPWFVWDSAEGVSEDFFWCEKIAQYGYEVKVFTDVRLSHGLTGKVRTDGAVHVLDV